MSYVLHCNDEFTCREQLKKLRQQGNFDYNQDTYYGGEVSRMSMLARCNTKPLLTEQRLVGLEGLPKRRHGEGTGFSSEIETETPEKSGKSKKSKKGRKSGPESRAGFEKDLAAYIPHLPESTVLVVLVDEELPSSNPLLKAAEEHGKVIQCTLPQGAALETWISKRAAGLCVKITPAAAATLANFIGNQLRMLAHELDKLATYVGPGAAITVEDVRQLSAQVQAARTFDLTDALAHGNRKQALDLLHDLLADGEPPLRLISTITWQVRSLLLVKELAGDGLRISQNVSATGMAHFVAEKALRQVGKFTSPQLERIYRHLLSTYSDLNRSRMTPEIAFDF